MAVATAVAVKARERQLTLTLDTFLNAILPSVPSSEVRRKLEKALDVPAEATYQAAAKRLGNGRPAIAQTTIAFALWAAGRSLGDFEAAITKTASAGGDIDTNCAIVGGIVASYTGLEQIPADWIQRLETLPAWAFSDEDEA